MTNVLVSSGGGHLRQMLSLVPRLNLDGPVVWVTPSSGLARGFLSSEQWYVIPNLPSRDWKGALKVLPYAHKVLTQVHASRIISTGAAPAPPFFTVGASMGLDLHYIESATRSEGPSLSGRMIQAALPSAHLYTQYPECATGRWHYRGNVLDPYTPVERPTEGNLDRVVVTLGTEKYGFRRAVEKLLSVLPRTAEVLWQTGKTDVSGLPIKAHESVPGHELHQAIADADVVISHAGTGSAITAFEVGKRPLLLPREAKHGEHVDDHQMLTATSLSKSGLVVAPMVDELTEAHVRECLSTAVLHDSEVHPFRLDTEPALTAA